MLIYLDMCCLKRPFDDQSQPRIRLESEAVLTILAREPDSVQFVRSTALVLENNLNPIRERALKVGHWLTGAPLWQPKNLQELQRRVSEFVGLGLKSFDALHLASAEEASAELFVSTDDRLLTIAKRNQGKLRTKPCALLECVREISK
jgi:hypothetical protein